MQTQIGILKKNVIDALGLSIDEKPIFMGDQNIDHMKNTHPEDFKKYSDDISDIIQNPTYVSLHPNNNSIQYIKEYIREGKHILLAVRASGKGIFFARTLFEMTETKFNNYKNSGRLIRI